MTRKNPTRDWFKSMEKISTLAFGETLSFPLGRRFKATHNFNHNLIIEVKKDGLHLTKERKSK